MIWTGVVGLVQADLRFVWVIIDVVNMVRTMMGVTGGDVT